MENRSPKFKVFLVDDSALVRGKLRGLFSALPAIEVCGEAGSAEDALNLIGHQAVDAVILDLDLHHSQGLDVLTTLKQMERPPVVIILTIHPFRDLGRYYLDAGADHYFEKGRNFDGLMTLLENLSLNRSPETGSPPPASSTQS